MDSEEIQARALRDFADRIDAAYPPEVFIPPDEAKIAAIHAMFAEKGFTVDGWSAVLMRQAARIARIDADRILEGEE